MESATNGELQVDNFQLVRAVLWIGVIVGDRHGWAVGTGFFYWLMVLIGVHSVLVRVSPQFFSTVSNPSSALR